MNVPAKLIGFGVVLAAVFAASLGVGAAVGPISGTGGNGEHGAHDDGASGKAADAADGSTSAGLDTEGLAISAGGYTFDPVATVVAPGAPTAFNFRILGPGGAPVTRYAPRHDRELHLIVVRRDLAGYQHLHPRRAADGTWTVSLTLASAGVYKAYADFDPAGGAPPMTLAGDIFASGDFEAQSLPAPSATATVDGFAVTLRGALTAGEESDLSFTVAKDGAPVVDLEPYLGAFGHLVALRAGDLAYLHVHPEGAPGDGHTRAGPEITFHAEVPAAGSHRLFLDFQHGGVVRTAEFTVVATGASS
ncbi:MAG TPA: hypothetical protein VM121_06035 [Acidimicrobiales bacterium]|nr:hypothetical protein [Acidimicrobiales bacterium]